MGGGAGWRLQVTNLWAVGHGYWVGTSRIVGSRICGGRDGFGLGGFWWWVGDGFGRGGEAVFGVGGGLLEKGF